MSGKLWAAQQAFLARIGERSAYLRARDNCQATKAHRAAGTAR